MKLFFFRIIGYFFISGNIFAGTMVIYPKQAAEPDSNAGAFQSVTLGSIYRVQPSPWIVFLANLQTCTSGKYVLPQIDLTLLNQYGDLAVYEISGTKDNKCEVIITLKNSQYGTGQSAPAQSLCKFSTETIQLFTARYTNLMNKRDPAYQTDAEDYFDHMAKECKGF